MTKKISEVNDLLAQAMLDCECLSCRELVDDTLTPSEATHFWRSTTRLGHRKEEVDPALHELRVQLNNCEGFFDMLFRDVELSKGFRTDLAKIRCSLCGIHDCSTRNDPEECLRITLLKPVETKPR
jgi:hypothetical protein